MYNIDDEYLWKPTKPTITLQQEQILYSNKTKKNSKNTYIRSLTIFVPLNIETKTTNETFIYLIDKQQKKLNV